MALFSPQRQLSAVRFRHHAIGPDRSAGLPSCFTMSQLFTRHSPMPPFHPLGHSSFLTRPSRQPFFHLHSTSTNPPFTPLTSRLVGNFPTLSQAFASSSLAGNPVPFSVGCRKKEKESNFRVLWNHDSFVARVDHLDSGPHWMTWMTRDDTNTLARVSCFCVQNLSSTLGIQKVVWGYRGVMQNEFTRIPLQTSLTTAESQNRPAHDLGVSFLRHLHTFQSPDKKTTLGSTGCWWVGLGVRWVFLATECRWRAHGSITNGVGQPTFTLLLWPVMIF